MNNVNHILDTIDLGSTGGEPVSLSEMHNYLRLQGFIDDSDSTSVDEFTDDNLEIMSMIKAARQQLELALECSIVTHSFKAVGVTNQCGHVKLKFGPVISISSIKNESGDEYDDDLAEDAVYGEDQKDTVKLAGDYLVIPKDCNMTVEYNTGYSSQNLIPRPLITEIKRMVAYMYEHRGDEDLAGYKYSPGIFKYSKSEILM